MTRPIARVPTSILRQAAVVTSEIGEIRLAAALFALEADLLRSTNSAPHPRPRRCTCDQQDGSACCEVHVSCDQECRALRFPDEDDAEQLREAFDHWRNHSVYFGCSHGN